MLDANVKAQLKSYMEMSRDPIERIACHDDAPKSLELREQLGEIAGMSDKITLVERSDLSDRKPSFRIARVGTDIGVTFAGIPLGHEFTSLVLALLQVGGHPIKLEES